MLKAASTGEVLEDNLSETCKHLDQDFDHSRLKNQLAVLLDLVCHVNPLQDIHKAILALGTMSSLFSEVHVLKLLQLLYVIPATTATAEQSFSFLQRIKTYLRNTMTTQRLNHMMILHVHKHITHLA